MSAIAIKAPITVVLFIIKSLMNSNTAFQRRQAEVAIIEGLAKATPHTLRCFWVAADDEVKATAGVARLTQVHAAAVIARDLITVVGKRKAATT